MFTRRLRWLLIAFAGLGVVLVARLFELQVLRAAEFELLAVRMVTRPERMLPAPRGAILDRAGRLLAADEPAFDVLVHYGVLAARADYLNACARELRRRGEFPTSQPIPEIATELRLRIGEMWNELAQLTGRPLSEIVERGASVREQVERVSRVVRERSPTIERIEMEDQMFSLVDALDNDTALRVRLALERHPWLRVAPASRRVVRAGDSLVHVLGRTGPASRELIEADELAHDEFRRRRPGDRTGTSGAERAADAVLRGASGRLVEEPDGRVLDYVAPIPGEDVRLTIDAALQDAVLERLAAAVEKSVHPAGGAAVVLDVQTREVLALVSYPVYSREDAARRYAELLADTRRAPLLSRAVAAQYAPGSICKVATVIAGLSEGVVSPQTRIHCTGRFIPTMPNAFRCWIYNQNPGVTHDMGNPAGQTAEDAIRNSCNIYFFSVGDRLGAGRLTAWFERLGLGRTQGTGLVEEVAGIVPTRDWMQRRQRRDHQPADAWNFSIGQGEVTCTPLQAAGIAATVAAGRWEPVRLIVDPEGAPVPPRLAERFTLDEALLRPVRAGMWRVVNERGGTAHVARLERRDFELCGKTGSAQAVPTVLSRRYIFEWPDGRREEVVAASESEARSALDEEQPRLVGTRAAERYPAIGPEDRLPAHAWFIGYTQSTSTRRGAAPQGPSYAIAVLIEFGGSGGRVAGPAAREIANAVIEWSASVEGGS
ncbi:MAG: hypothetical protein IPM64_05695 [Phycisphaerales bacterium]|nr:hypothetical protein [Phycisphaerales bacterium]